jgi:hypothetical protein
MSAAQLWWFLPVGYAVTVAVETPVLLAGLSARHPLRRRLFAGLWLTACTYPVVILVLTQVPWPGPWAYLAVAETFAPAAECALFQAAFGTREVWGKPSMWRDWGAIVVANLLSFLAGEILHAAGAF